MTVRTVVFPFGYYAEVKRTKQRVVRPGRFRSNGGVAVETVAAPELVTAFRIEEPHGRQRRCYPVFLYGDRLWWPLFNPLTPYRDERQTLHDAVAGRVNLFGDDILDDSTAAIKTVDDPTIVMVEVSQEEAAHTQMQRLACDLLLVDGDRLFAAGGHPVIVTWQRRLRIVNTGATRSGDPTASGLSLQPGHHGSFLGDWAICRGKFWRGRSQSMDEEIRRLRCQLDRVPVIDRCEGAGDNLLSDFELQTDSAYRLMDFIIWNRVMERSASYDDLLALFARARPEGPPDLTARRLTALDACATLLGKGWFLNALPLGCGERVLELVKNAPAAARQLLPTDAGLSPEEDEALEHA